MAITNVIDGVTEEVLLAAATSFSISMPTTITADGFAADEFAVVYRLGPSGDYKPATNKDGAIFLSAYPNTAVLEAEGTYKIIKAATNSAAYVGYGA